ncbi:MAG: hypothetical protein MUC85_09520 [Anaerolineales bacterium]|nr:hypothetical protein [Anaerolineales bacterium]
MLDVRQVQTYESIMLNSDGEVTTVLLRAAAYAKDNRLLPQGFDLVAATPDTLSFGATVQDGDFTAGGDWPLHRAGGAALPNHWLSLGAEPDAG